MKKEEKEFYPGQNVLIVDIKSSARNQAIVFSVDSLNLINPKISVRNSGGEVLIDKKTLRGETVFGPCTLMHIKV